MITTQVYNGNRKVVNKDGKTVLIPVPPTIILAHGGPLLRIGITHPKSVLEQFQKQGKIVQPIEVKALIDTGAGASVITPEIAAKLQLVQTGFRKITSVQDEKQQPAYFCMFLFPWGRGKEVSVAACPLKGIDCLIGRDVLQHWHLTYNGKDGLITICD